MTSVQRTTAAIEYRECCPDRWPGIVRYNDLAHDHKLFALADIEPDQKAIRGCALDRRDAVDEIRGYRIGLDDRKSVVGDVQRHGDFPYATGLFGYTSGPNGGGISSRTFHNSLKLYPQLHVYCGDNSTYEEITLLGAREAA